MMDATNTIKLQAVIAICALSLLPESFAQSNSCDTGPPACCAGGAAGLPSQKPRRASAVDKVLRTALDEVGGTAAALLSATIGNTDIDLPPDTNANPDWPFRAPHRRAQFTVYWSDGKTATISRLPDGSFQMLGGGHCLTIQKEQCGTYAVLGEDGSTGTLTPRLDGGYTFMRPDGSSAVLLPRSAGGFDIVSAGGTPVRVIPGPGGSKHIFTGSL